MNHFDTLVIHHSGGPRSQTVEAVRRFHTAPPPEGRGWSDIGYHWIIDGSAKLHIGRRIPNTGSHAPPNDGRLGVMVMGDNTDPDQSWTFEQVYALQLLVEAVNMLMPWMDVTGHRDIMPGHTQCPGVDVGQLFGL